MEMSKVKPGYLLFKLCLGLIVYFTKSESAFAQELWIEQGVTFSNATGPVTTIKCVATFPEDSTDHLVKLSLHSIVLAENGHPTVSTHRYDFDYFSDSVNSTLRLNIINAIKQDEGLYQCEMEYKQNVTLPTPIPLINETYVTIEQYLPAPNFPTCDLHPPGPALLQGDIAFFNCNAGDSNPNVKLELQLTGTLLEYDQNTVSHLFVINARYNNTKFACVMKSDTFPTANRACYVGPVQVFMPPPSTTYFENLTNNSIPDQQLTTQDITTLESPSSKHSITFETLTSAKPSFTFWIIIGGSTIGALVLFILIISICALIKKVSHVQKSMSEIQLQSVDADGYSQVQLKGKKLAKGNRYEPQPMKINQSVSLEGDNPYAKVQDVEPTVASISSSKSTFNPNPPPPPVPSTPHPNIHVSTATSPNLESTPAQDCSTPPIPDSPEGPSKPPRGQDQVYFSYPKRKKSPIWL